MAKSFAPPAVTAYIDKHFAHQSPVQRKIREYTATLPNGQMLTDPDQAALLSLLVRMAHATNALEIGTFTGYSALAIASALPEGGRLTCLDVNPTTSAIAQAFWREAGLAERITLILGPAAETLKTFQGQPLFDFAFIDADKEGYDGYYEAVLPLLKPGAAMLFDNMIRPGVVEGRPVDAAARAIAALNEKLAADPRVAAQLLTIGPGMVLAVKK